MTPKEIKKSIETMNVHFNKNEYFEHWFNFFFFLVPVSLIGYVKIEEAIQNKEFSFFPFALIVFFFWFLRHKLVSSKLKEYELNLTEEQFKQANEATANLNNWRISSNRKNYFSAIKSSGFQWDGIKVTAILRNEKVYLNSMVNPSTRSNPFTFGINNKNRLKLIQQYQSILKGDDVIEIVNKKVSKREEKFWSESDWIFKYVIMRVIIYGISILFIAILISLIFSGAYEAIILGIPIIGCCIYIYVDIKIMIEKRNKKKRL